MCLLLTGSLKTFGRMEGTRMEFTPPSFTLIWDKNDDLLWVLPIWGFLPWDIDWRGSGVKSCSHSSPEDKIEFWNYPERVQTQVLLSKANEKRDLNTLRSHPQNSVTHSFDLHTRIWSFVIFALMNIQMWYFSSWYNFYHCWPNGKHWQWQEMITARNKINFWATSA